MKYASPRPFKLRNYIPGLLIAALVLTFFGSLVHLLTESWWFASAGFEGVFWTRLRWQVGIGLVVFGLYAVFLGINYRLAKWVTRDRSYRFLERYPKQSIPPYLPKLPEYGAIALILATSLVAALNSAAAWETLLQFLNPTAFNVSDPIFQRDVGFYIFRLPFFEAVQEAGLGLLLWAILLSLSLYALKGEIRPARGWKYFLTGEVKAHLCILLAGVALVVTLGFWLQRFELLYSPAGVVFGAGYTDVHARLQAFWTMGFVTLSTAALFLVALRRSGFSLPIFGIVIYLFVLILINGLYPWLQQQFVVEPNELAKETPYIANNIEFTRQAYNLQNVEVQPFPAENGLTREALAQNQPTISNIPLWDYRPLLSTYRQLQEIRLYYRFQDVDVDRYTLNGDYRQVMLSARELAYDQLPPEAQTWINQRLKFTHGYGVVMSPVNEVTPDGLPELFIKNIPPVSTVDLTIDQPRIYYGEEDLNYIFTGSVDEFDYPEGDTNATFRYDGAGGVPLNSLLRRFAYAYDFANLKILISSYINSQSRIHYYRQVQDRIRQVAPFLFFDNDPYIAIIDGRLVWIVDAYTVSNRYPYSQPLSRSNDIESVVGEVLRPLLRRNINYIRNSVKVTVDAYDGSMHFYAIDEADAILNTYRQIFPDLFEPAEQMSPEVRDHLRYPPDFFQIQAQMYRAYHMTNPEVFYNREDLWRFPTQIYEGNEVLMEPYYLIMRLPGADTAEFIQIMPFTPANKDNMVAWMTGRSDGEHYGKLLLYEFPKQELVFGPSQIEARIDQTPEISEQLTLWSQEGSRVIRGDLLVIPIDQSLLYVESIYLRAETGELPELIRVIVAHNDQIVMRETLAQSLAAVFGEALPEEFVAEEVPPPSPATIPPSADLIEAALDAFEAGQTALQQGDWQRYGETQAELREILQQLSQSP